MPDLLLPDLLAGGWRELAFAEFRPGIRIHRIYGDGSAAAAALLIYEPGASVPLHEHTGYEHVLMLEGEQEDDRGRYPAGTLAINPPGSRHSVRSPAGCVALLVWERPVRFVAD
jgi:anti-sigma factor ChrR (cupin superfamily)